MTKGKTKVDADVLDALTLKEFRAAQFKRKHKATDCEESELPKGNDNTLIVDVYSSTSLVPQFANRKLRDSVAGDTTIFSYDEPGKHYYPWDTHRRLEDQARRFARYLPKREGVTTKVVAASFGCPTSVLGARAWIERKCVPRESVSLAVPRLILVAPAFRASSGLLDQYESRGRAAPHV